MRKLKPIFPLLLLCSLLWSGAGSALADPAPAAPAAPAATSPTVQPSDEALKERIQEEKKATETRFSILPHRPNYLLPIAYNSSPNRQVYANAPGATDNLNNLEVKFQISLKTPIWNEILGSKANLYVAYSQLAFWQAYNSNASSPFREINFEPEIFVAYPTGYHFPGMTSEAVTLGLDHQSNGRSSPLSRSWNRVVANLLFSVGGTYVNLRPWYRIPEKANNDDNPDIEKYLGYGELLMVRKFRENTLSLLLRNNLRWSENHGAVQLGWSFSLGKKMKGYVQYFYGYGESLIDYNHLNNRFGIGVALTDWL